MSSEEIYDIFDERFRALVNRHALVQRLHTGTEWGEGPAYFAGGLYLVWSDIPGNRMLRFDEADGHVSVFRQPSGHANGNSVDRQGRLVTCEHSGRRISRTEHDGTVITLADGLDGKRFNSPNDLVVKSDGSIWFTDPSYGIESDYQGRAARSEVAGCHVYRIDPQTWMAKAMITDMVRPNGLAFSPDESRLYVADTARPSEGNKLGDMLVFDIDATGRPANGRLFANRTSGGFDGFRLDSAGRLWASAGTNVECYEPDGTLLGRIRFPEATSNCCFGGPDRNLLYVTGATSLYRVRLAVNGLRTY